MFEPQTYIKCISILNLCPQLKDVLEFPGEHPTCLDTYLWPAISIDLYIKKLVRWGQQGS